MAIFTPAIPVFLLLLTPSRLSLPFSLSQELSIPGSLLDLGAGLRWVCMQHGPLEVDTWGRRGVEGAGEARVGEGKGGVY